MFLYKLSETKGAAVGQQKSGRKLIKNKNIPWSLPNQGNL
jgi:hypothetical protein